MINDKSISDIVMKLLNFPLKSFFLGNVPLKVAYLIKTKTKFKSSIVGVLVSSVLFEKHCI